MTEIKRDPMTRGTKMMKDSVFGSAASDKGLLAIEDDYKTSNVSKENLQTPRGAFNIHFSVPYLDSELVNYHAESATLNPGNSAGWCAPFNIPPLQEFFQDPEQGEPILVLEGLTVSFDQRSEGAIVHGMFQDVVAAGADKDATSGEFSYSEIDRLGLKIVIYEKTPLIDMQENAALNARLGGTKNNWQPNYLAERVVFEITLADVLFAGKGRLNPYLLTGINRQLDPYKSYCVAVLFPDIEVTDNSPRADFVFPAFNLSLKVTHPLVPTPWRQVGINQPQNAPNKNFRKDGHTDISINVPSDGSLMRADTTGGISEGTAQLDKALRKKLRGGLDSWCNAPGSEALADDSTYDIIVVPLFQMPFNGMIKSTALASGGAAALPLAPGSYFGSPTQLPYYSTDLTATESRRIIPIPYPMEIHHVFANISHQKSLAVASDANPSIRHKIGVGLGVGMQGDFGNHTQVAYADFVPKWGDGVGYSVPPELIDRWTYPWNRGVDAGAVFDGGAAYDANIAWETYGVPLVYTVGSEGEGYITQGTPVFAGQATGGASGKVVYNGVNPRSPISSGVAGVDINSRIHGCEQWIEVRWQMIADDLYAQRDPGWTNLTGDSTIVAYQGNFLVIVGKKYLTE